MPFIRGRYHINPVLGEALEAAREAESALLALEDAAQRDRQGNDEYQSDTADAEYARHGNSARQPIHRVEIEAAEVVPSHSGRAQRGFVARVHRQAASGAPEQHDGHTSPAQRFLAHHSSAALPPRGSSLQPETHVFADHRDLANFLRDELADDCK